MATTLTTDRLADRLRGCLGERVSTSPVVREGHGRDESHHPPFPPDIVVFPETVEEVVAVVGLCREHRTPIIPFGVGTSLEGHVAALEGGCRSICRG